MSSNFIPFIDKRAEKEAKRQVEELLKRHAPKSDEDEDDSSSSVAVKSGHASDDDFVVPDDEPLRPEEDEDEDNDKDNKKEQGKGGKPKKPREKKPPAAFCHGCYTAGLKLDGSVVQHPPSILITGGVLKKKDGVDSWREMVLACSQAVDEIEERPEAHLLFFSNLKNPDTVFTLSNRKLSENAIGRAWAKMLKFDPRNTKNSGSTFSTLFSALWHSHRPQDIRNEKVEGVVFVKPAPTQAEAESEEKAEKAKAAEKEKKKKAKAKAKEKEKEEKEKNKRKLEKEEDKSKASKIHKKDKDKDVSTSSNVKRDESNVAESVSKSLALANEKMAKDKAEELKKKKKILDEAKAKAAEEEKKKKARAKAKAEAEAEAKAKAKSNAEKAPDKKKDQRPPAVVAHPASKPKAAAAFVQMPPLEPDSPPDQKDIKHKEVIVVKKEPDSQESRLTLMMKGADQVLSEMTLMFEAREKNLHGKPFSGFEIAQVNAKLKGFVSRFVLVHTAGYPELERDFNSTGMIGSFSTKSFNFLVTPSEVKISPIVSSSSEVIHIDD